MLKNTTEQYGIMARALHWIMALMIIGIISVGFYMTSMEDGDDKWELYRMHKAFGVIVLMFVLFRWFWMLTNTALSPLANYTALDRKLAKLGKWALMILMLVMPLSGLAMSAFGGRATSVFGLFSVPGFAEANKSVAGVFHDIHVFSGWGIAIMVGLHILFALKHHFVDNDATLKRMLGRH